jgi:Protein of unknown function (DUF2384)
MQTAASSRPEVLVTGTASKIALPEWVRPYSAKTASLKKIRALSHLAPLTVVFVTTPAAIAQHEILSLLASRQRTTARPSKIVFVFEDADARAQDLARVLESFSRVDDVELARGPEQGAFAVEEAVAKILVDRRHEAARAAADPLGQVRSVVVATADLRVDTGRLSARRIAEAFGLSTAELAALLGRSRQTVAKTDDAPALQAVLRPFERIARLRAVLPAGDFRRWLNQPAAALDGKAPLDVIRARRAEVVADLVEDMLSGNPA